MRMRRRGSRRSLRSPWTVALLVVAAWVAIPAATALAHGGNYAPPPSTGPGTGPGYGPPGGGSGGGSGGGGGGGLAPTTPGSRVLTQPGASSVFDETWESWWAFTRWSFLPDRDALRLRMAARITAGSGGVGQAGAGAKGDEGRAREIAATTRVVPFLLELCAPERRVRDDVRASALIALGKAARGPVAIAVLTRWLKERRASDLVRESAALGLGMLRRDDPDEQLDAATYDRIRSTLLTAFDDDRNTSQRTQSFAALALGLLGDQPFGALWGGNGQAMVRAIWNRLSDRRLDPERSIALLTALGCHPPEDVTDKHRETLHAAVLGKRFRGRKLDAWERAHTLATVARLGTPGCDGLLIRVLDKRKEDTVVRCSAVLGLGSRAAAMSPEDRSDAIASLVKLARNPRDPATTGLGYVALGRLVGADVRAEPEMRLCAGKAHALLVDEAKSSSLARRGYCAVALALASRDLPAASRTGAVLGVTALRTLRAGLHKGDGQIRSAYAVALGLLGKPQANEDLLAIVNDRQAWPALRGRAAVALGQIGKRSTEIVAAVRALLADRRSEDLRGEAALGLSLLGDSTGLLHLVRQVRPRSTERMVAQVATALGRLDDLAAVGPLLEIARDESRTELTQALAVVSLGLLTDPAPRSSLLRLTRDANYVARTPVLHELLTIL